MNQICIRQYNEGFIYMTKLGTNNPDQLIMDAFNTIFNSVDDGGFCSESGVYPVLEYTLDKRNIIYKPSNEKYWRYNPFLMMGVLYTRFYVKNDWIELYDTKIQNELQIFITKLPKKEINTLSSYSLGPLMVSFAFAYKIYKDYKYIEIIESILNSADFKIKTNEDAFLLLGLTQIYEFIPDYQEIVFKKIETLTGVILKHQNKTGLFVFEGITSKRHQNQMYTLWALCSSFRILEIDNVEPIRKNIEYTIRNRFENDGGIIWEDNIPYHIKAYHILKGIRYWEYYFECHQCFFAHAVFKFSELSQDFTYNTHAIKSLEWIFGGNRFNINLLHVSGLNMPHRIIDVNGNLHVKGQQFKGTYEIGGYLMAISDCFIKNQFI